MKSHDFCIHLKFGSISKEIMKNSQNLMKIGLCSFAIMFIINCFFLYRRYISYLLPIKETNIHDNNNEIFSYLNSHSLISSDNSDHFWNELSNSFIKPSTRPKFKIRIILNRTHLAL